MQIAGAKGAWSNKCTHKTAIIAINVKDGSVKEFISQSEAEKILGISNSNINKALRGERKTTHGYRFEYTDKPINEKYEQLEFVFNT